MQKFTTEEIFGYWTEQAKEHGTSSAASWTDFPVINLEINELASWLNDGDKVLDVGCANGHSTLRLAMKKSIRARGLDYVPEMIEAAHSELKRLSPQLVGEVEFAVGDINSLEEPDNFYDTVITTRVLINLGEWSQQVAAVKECARVLKPGGLLLLSEATTQGMNALNRFRGEWGLQDIPEPSFNRYLDYEALIKEVADTVNFQKVVDFASSYYVGSRVLKPLLIQALRSSNDVARPDMEWNRWFASMPPAGDYGTQKLLVFRKPTA